MQGVTHAGKSWLVWPENSWRKNVTTVPDFFVGATKRRRDEEEEEEGRRVLGRLELRPGSTVVGGVSRCQQVLGW